MKNILLAFLLVFGLNFGANAQTKAVENTVISTPTVQCGMCKGKIEKWLSQSEGVKAVKVDIKKKQVHVTYLTDRTNKENLKAEIANLGYDAEDVKAEPDAYKKLPTCCKKPEDRD